MSREPAARLPDELIDRLARQRARSDPGVAFVLCSLDAAGWPHPAMVSAFEVAVLDAARLRLATHDTSRTSANLEANGRVTLAFVDEGAAWYVKGLAARSAVPAPPGHAFFDVQVQQVKADTADAAREGEARIVSGIRYAADDVHVQRAREMLARLEER
jgi:flavin reductase (DIM6/NTAB) family NADH-FMN oxidoreductase RutF